MKFLHDRCEGIEMSADDLFRIGRGLYKPVLFNAVPNAVLAAKPSHTERFARFVVPNGIGFILCQCDQVAEQPLHGPSGAVLQLVEWNSCFFESVHGVLIPVYFPERRPMQR